MQKAKVLFFLPLQTFPIDMHSIEQDSSTNHIGHDEGNGAINGAIHMGFSSEVDDTIRLEVVNHGLHHGGIGDVPFHKLISGIIRNRDQIVKISSVGQFIQIENMVVGFNDLLQDKVGADEACSACDNYFPQIVTPLNQLN